MKNKPVELALFISSICFAAIYTALFLINREEILQQGGAVLYPLTILILGGLLAGGLAFARGKGRSFSKIWPLAPMLYVLAAALTYASALFG